MDIKDYKFKVGDEVITTEGIRGEITDVCRCSSCHRREFYEPTWVDEYGDYHYITKYDAESGFTEYYKIGTYYFSNFDTVTVLKLIEIYEKDLSRLKIQLKTIEDIKNGK